jgi:hypothetical protein
MASAALQHPTKIEAKKLLLLRMLAAAFPTTTPIIRAGRARGPVAIKKPAATPDAGQNAAMSECAESKACPRRAARKYAIATALAAARAPIDSLAAGARRNRLSAWGVPAAFKAPRKSMVQELPN